MNIPFIKMHGLGNDFVVLDHRQNPLEITPEQAARLADRRLGIGCDQIVQIVPADVATAHVQMRIYNADGSQAEMCGNAARCVGLYLRKGGGRPEEGTKANENETLILQTLAGLIHVSPQGQALVSVDMGKPLIDPLQSTLTTPDGHLHTFTGVSMGNPHCVIFCPEVDRVPLALEGPPLENHPRFPNRTNVEFVQILDADHIRMRVWERGVGVTPACGTGACAAAVATQARGLTDRRRLVVSLDGGDLVIDWRPDNRVIMTGPATESFRGEINL